MCSLMEVDLCKVTAGTHHAYDEKQHEQGKPDSLQRTVDIYNHIPYRTALELLWGLGNELPYFSQLLIPSIQGVLQVLYDPVIRHSTTSLLKLGISGSPRSDLPDMLCLLSSGYGELACDEGQNLLCKGNDYATCKGQKAVRSLGRVVGFEG